MKEGTRIEATGKSHHVGQTGIVVKDYINFLLIKADDDNYPHAFKNSIADGNYFQVDSRYAKEIK